MKRSSWFVVLASLGAIGGVVACSGSDEVGGGSTPVDPSGSQATLSTHTEALSAEASDVVQVTDTQLVFPSSYASLLNKQAGDVLLGERQRPGTLGKNPQGFLRKVRSVHREGSTIVVDTEGAALVEAFQQLSFRTNVQGPAFTAEGPVGERTADGAGFLLPQGGGKTIEVLNFTGKKLFDVNKSVKLGDKNIGIQAFAKVDQGYLNFTPSYDIGADIEPPKLNILGGGGIDISLPKLKGFHASATGAMEAKLVLNAGIKLDTDLDSASFTQLIAQEVFKSPTATLADYPFDLGSVKAGPISIPINGGFKAVLACDFDWNSSAEVKYGGQVNASLKVGVKYENDKISPIFEKSGNLQQVGPDFQSDGLVKVKCKITPTFDLKLWDLGSAQIWASAYAGVGGSLSCKGGAADQPKQATIDGKAIAGVRAGLKANLDLLGLIKFNKDCTLFDLSTGLKSYTKDFTLPGGSNATCTGDKKEIELEEPPAPEKCFGSGGGTGGTGGTGGSGGSGPGSSCTPGVENTPAQGWTCDSKKWNDCKCDCDCGARDPDCGDGECAACDHDVCTVGTALGSKCDECTKKMCEVAPYCCEETWGVSCLARVEDVCGQKCELDCSPRPSPRPSPLTRKTP